MPRNLVARARADGLTLLRHRSAWPPADAAPGQASGGPLKKFLPPLETKNRFANFFVAIEGWRPGAGRAWSGETGTGRVRCRS